MTRLAAIAIGSNSTRLLCADTENDVLSSPVRGRCETRVFMGLEDGCITRECMQRTCKAVEELKEKALKSNAQRIDLFATSAMRDARNSELLAQMLFVETGLSLQIISGEREAELSFIGTCGKKHAALCDIGGGSCEIAFGKDGKILTGISAQMGASRLYKMQKITCMEDAQRALQMAEDAILPLAEKMTSAYPVPDTLYAVGGTSTTLSDMYLGEIDTPRTEGQEVTLSFIKECLQKTAPLTPEERMKIPGLRPARADIIPQGICIMLTILKALGRDKIIVSKHGNLDGYLLEINK